MVQNSVGRWAWLLRLFVSSTVGGFPGMIHVSNTSDPIVSEDSTVHNVAITALKWNADGSRLVSADKVACLNRLRVLGQ
jgi:WD40 repeat protein